ncbi:MAG: MCP four helix bundle domain-containing protein [Deltaproteobacteria bacterium]|nr:MCP four helix bundle domain-containing protein [Deltaproteobacteria bacterium]
MLKGTKLSIKLIGGFMAVALITLGLGFMGWRTVSSMDVRLEKMSNVHLPAWQNLAKISRSMEFLLAAQRTLLNPSLSEVERQVQRRNLEKAKETYQAACQAYEALPKGEEEAQVWEEFVQAADAWLKENAEYLEKFRGDYYAAEAQILQMFDNNGDYVGMKNSAESNFGKWLADFRTDNPVMTAALLEVKEPHQRFHAAAKKIKGLMRVGDVSVARGVFRREMVPAVLEMSKHFDTMREEAAKAERFYDQMTNVALVKARDEEAKAQELLRKLMAVNAEDVAKAKKESTTAAARSIFLSLAGMVVGFVLALILGIFLSLSITRPLNRVIAGLSEGSDQVSAASSQVSTASQSLAQGASQQAAAIQETSSSLEEMASMTKSNADHAKQADSLMSETTRVVEAANTSMGQLTEAMKEVSLASEETAKIIKTIDEIGAGFAVVADEVRSLAMRAAEAAKNTADLIETTAARVKEGSDLVGRTSEAFDQVVSSAAKVKELVAEIAAASSEQAQGVEQINKAVSEMNNIIQQTAANAEESASAAEELNAQAEQMKAQVRELMAIVGGAANGRSGIKNRLKVPLAMAGGRLVKRSAPAKKLLAQPLKAQPATAEQVIPLEEGDFKDF